MNMLVLVQNVVFAWSFGEFLYTVILMEFPSRTQHIHYCTKMKEILEEINLGSSYPHESAFDVFEQK